MMFNVPPPGGWPLRLAIYALAPASRKQPQHSLPGQEVRGLSLVDQCQALLSRGESYVSLAGANRILWLDLLDRHRSGELVLKGRANESIDFVEISSITLNEAIPDISKGSISCGNVTFYGVRVFERPNHIADTIQATESAECAATLSKSASSRLSARDRQKNKADAKIILAAEKVSRTLRQEPRITEAEAGSILEKDRKKLSRADIRDILHEVYAGAITVGRRKNVKNC